MEVKSTAQNSIMIRLALFILLATCLIQAPVSAHPTVLNTGAPQNTHIDLYKNIWINPGLARGQTLRYTWANVSDPDPGKRKFEAERIRVRLLAADGRVIAEAEAAAVGVGEFQSFDFNRDEISLRGEDPHGRLQTLLESTVSGNTRNGNLDVKQAILETFQDTMEVIDNFDGRTSVGVSDTPGQQTLNPGAFQIISAGKDHLIGIAFGQKLRVSVLNPAAPPVPGDGRKFKPLFAFIVLAADGRVIAQSDDVPLDPGQFHSFDVRRADLPLSGEPGGRVQTRVRVIWQKLGLKAEFPTMVELVDESTGKTTVLLSQKPKEIVVVGSN